MIALEYLGVYLLWTLALWVTHWLAHVVKRGPLYDLHCYHHKLFFEGEFDDLPPRWIRLLGFYTTDWKDIAEQTATEVLPTIPVCIVTGHWWPLAIVWFDNAFISPYLDHKPNNYWWFGHGTFHTDHHENSAVNYGFYTIVWDVIFRTFRRPERVANAI